MTGHNLRVLEKEKALINFIHRFTLSKLLILVSLVVKNGLFTIF